MAERFASRFEAGLDALNAGLLHPRTEKRPAKVWERLGRLKEKQHGIGQHYQIDLVEIEIWRTPVLGRLTSSVSVVSDFVANGYQTMQHVSTSPPAIPDGQISRVRF